ncbi:MAG: hypothetical protein AAF810_01480 [Cyanobacteria bacterium P01_D01_bin.36]
MTIYDDVRGWACDRSLIPGNPAKQMLKVIEELSEFLQERHKGYRPFDERTLAEGKELGDFLVTLVILAAQHDMDFENCSSAPRIERHGLDGFTIYLGKLAECIGKQNDCLSEAFGNLRVFVNYCSVNWLSKTSEQCLQLAYDSIRDRTGKTIDGVFVKTSDLESDTND